MFTGIVEEVGKVISLADAEVQDGSFRLTVGAAKVLDGLRLGDSVSVNGACLTAVDITPDGFSVDLAPENPAAHQPRFTGRGHGAKPGEGALLLGQAGRTRGPGPRG